MFGFGKKSPKIIELNAKSAHIKAEMKKEKYKFEKQQLALNHILNAVESGYFVCEFDCVKLFRYRPMLDEDTKKYLESLDFKIEIKTQKLNKQNETIVIEYYEVTY